MLESLNRLVVSQRLPVMRGWSHGNSNPISAGSGERATNMVFEHQGNQLSEWAAICSNGTKFGMTPETLRRWVRSAETEERIRPGLIADERGRLSRPPSLRPPTIGGGAPTPPLRTPDSCCPAADEHGRFRMGHRPALSLSRWAGEYSKRQQAVPLEGDPL